ncbi:MAG TPA: hypothetical protein VK735_36350 [Pseudonocardia sp.]|jgi:hypothetical protein|uniref:hypothetical protein n=1 Tax=Pseudonocardia sp. TaxID=60912 RepID=UPI002B7D7AFA|nr:hypothetical protein [Pseudonocardia sp.]HTF52949.1 hypothetical protein [Pseudonocardia sp.]
MRCTECGWPLAETELVSIHRTSEGFVSYRRCMCGRITIQLREQGASANAGAHVVGTGSVQRLT